MLSSTQVNTWKYPPDTAVAPGTPFSVPQCPDLNVLNNINSQFDFFGRLFELRLPNFELVTHGGFPITKISCNYTAGAEGINFAISCNA